MKKIIIANWKCNPISKKQVKELVSGLTSSAVKEAEIILCPPFCYLSLINNKFIKLGAQDCFYESAGPYTGQVSVEMLKDLGVKYVLVGHSEKRALKETNEVINKKIRIVLKTGLIPILCVGESLKQRTNGEAFKVIEEQIRKGVDKVIKKDINKIIIAYEPIWSIGTGRPCLPDNAETMSLFIRKIIGDIIGKKNTDKIKIVYGGSINSKNAGDYLASPWLSGLLVGGASLNKKEFLQILKKIVE